MKVRVLLGAVLTAVVLLYGAWEISGARGFQLLGRLIDRIETDRPLVALTFDDGPTPEASDSILAILREEGVRATFFFTGAELREYPDLGGRFVQAGHELGNHSYSHPRFLLRSPGFIRREIETTDSLIRATGYRGEIRFRPPYGKKLVGLPLYLRRTGRTTVMWDIEPDSYPEVAASAAGIETHVLERARPGSIVLLHVMYPGRRTSLESVRGVIRGLRARGLEPVRVADLLSDESS